MDGYILKDRAKSKLAGKWGMAIGAMIIVSLLNGTSYLEYIDKSLGTIGMIIGFILMPVAVGYARFHYNIATGKHAEIGDIFSAFTSDEFGRALGAMLLQVVYLVGWMLLFIIPGIVKAFSYSMTVYILQDPDFKHLSSNETITKSRDMMDGYKAEYFMLILSFIGWVLLGVLTLGILFLYVGPYMDQTRAQFYLELKAKTNNIVKKEVNEWIEDY